MGARDMKMLCLFAGGLLLVHFLLELLNEVLWAWPKASFWVALTLGLMLFSIGLLI